MLGTLKYGRNEQVLVEPGQSHSEIKVLIGGKVTLSPECMSGNEHPARMARVWVDSKGGEAN